MVSLSFQMSVEITGDGVTARIRHIDFTVLFSTAMPRGDCKPGICATMRRLAGLNASTADAAGVGHHQHSLGERQLAKARRPRQISRSKLT